MDSRTNSSSMLKAARRKPLKTKNRQKASVDRHLKVDGRDRDRRIRLPVPCAKLVFQLNKKLGHKTAGQTVEWVLMHAMPEINDIMSIDTNLGLMNPITNSNAYNAPPSGGFMSPYPIPYQTPSVPLAPVATTAGMVTQNYFNGFMSGRNLAGERASGIAPRFMKMGQSSMADDFLDEVELSAEKISKFLGVA